MNLREKARRIKLVRDQVERMKKQEDWLFSRLKNQIDVDDNSDVVLFDYIFNGPFPGARNATEVAKLLD